MENVEKNFIKKTIKEFIGEYVDDYYADQQPGQYTGDASDLANDYELTRILNRDEEELLPIIQEMIKDKDLVENSEEWVNPENEQHTSYVDTIELPGFSAEQSEYINIRRSQSSFNLQHPDNYRSVERAEFETWRDETADALEYEESQSGRVWGIDSKEVRTWKSWDDVAGFDIL